MFAHQAAFNPKVVEPVKKNKLIIVTKAAPFSNVWR
jgi:hypothetical protein